MVKGGFGLKDAPRMWRLKLDHTLRQAGLKPTQADGSIYCKWRVDSSGEYHLVLIISTHVDDLKGGGVQREVDSLVAVMTKAFGQGKLEYSNFEHCGIKHAQNESDFSIVTTMDHYASQLKPIVSLELKTKPNEDFCSMALAALYGTLLGGLHW